MNRLLLWLLDTAWPVRPKLGPLEHSEATDIGLVAFQALDGWFEFAVANQGIGALRSLRSNERFAALYPDREALPLVLDPR